MGALSGEVSPARPERLAVSRILLVLQFVQFAIVGIAGLAAETGTFYALRTVVGIYAAGLSAYAVSATVTWWINRVWTFQNLRQEGSRSGQWVRYVLASAPGFLLNRTVFFSLVTLSGVCSANPVVAIAAGSLSGLFSNFTLSRLVVFGKAV